MKTLVQKLSVLQRSVIAVGVMAVTAVSFMFMSFHPVVEAPVKEQTEDGQGLYWYQRLAPNQYQKVTEAPSGCESEPSDQICALGFSTELNEHDVTDAMESSAAQRRYIPEN